MSNTTVTVRILDREYQVNCNSEEVDELAATARYLDSEMKKIRDAGKVLGVDRIAVMAALNISHDYLSLSQNHTESSEDSSRRISNLTGKISRSLESQKQRTLS